MLERVGVQRALRQGEVGLHIVVELDHAHRVALLFQYGLDAQLDLVAVGTGGGAEDDFLLGRIGRDGGAGQGQRDGGGQLTEEGLRRTDMDDLGMA